VGHVGYFFANFLTRPFSRAGRYCTKLRFDDPEQVLKDGNEAIFKGYLERRVKKSQNKESNRIEKASTIKTYWRLLLCKFIDLAGHRLQNGAEIEVGNVGSLTVLLKTQLNVLIVDK